MRKLFAALAIFSLAASFGVSYAQDPGSERITSFYTRVQFREGSTSLEVIENITYDFGVSERHGIYRDLPLSYNGGKGRLDIKEIKIAEGSALEPFEIFKDGGYLRIRIGNPDILVTGVKTYLINYLADGAVQWGEDSDVIAWNVTGNGWEVPIEEALAEVWIDAPGATYDCYQGPYGSTEQCVEELPSGNVGRIFRATRPLGPGEGLTFSVTLPKGILVPPTPTERALKLFFTYWPLLLPIATFIFLFRRWWEIGRDPKGRGTIIPQYEPPAGLSPIETGTLLSGKVKPVYVSAQIVYLATLGFLKITPVGDGSGKPDDYLLEKLKDTSGQGTSLDRLLMAALFSEGPSIKSIADIKRLMAAMKSKSEEEVLAAMEKDSTPRPSVKLSELKNNFSKSLEGIKGAVSQSLLQKGYYDRDPRKVFGAYAAVAFLLFFASFFLFTWWPLLLGGVIVSALIIGIFGWFMPKVTKQGAIEKEHILGFRNYLDIAEKDRLEFHNAPEKRPELFERFLPYALALGVVDAWAKEFKDIYLEKPQWYGGSAHGTFLAAGLANDLGRFSSVATKTAFASSSSGSGGSGGGFSGGGAGGGGGGSW